MSEKQTVYQRLAENLKDKPNHQIIDLAGEKILVKDFLKISKQLLKVLIC